MTSSNPEKTLTWILRGVGFVLVLIGLVCITGPLTTLFAVLPFLESIVGTGAFLVAFTLAVPITLLTIAVAWIAHRPLIGGGLVVAAIAVFYPCLRQLHPRLTGARRFLRARHFREKRRSRATIGRSGDRRFFEMPAFDYAEQQRIIDEMRAKDLFFVGGLPKSGSTTGCK